MPIIETPFDRIALDIVGSLPKTSRGHWYILVLADYTKRYPEALPLRAATAKAVAKELMLLFSRVGIAREVLTDQGSCFMSCVMRELLSLLQIKRLQTLVYHPQTDGLVERFNKTLTQMLKKAMDADGKNWDQLLPHVLFAVREVPQASTGFSPFELLYGRRPRGILDLAKEAWESRTTLDHVLHGPPHYAGPCRTHAGPHGPGVAHCPGSPPARPAGPGMGLRPGSPAARLPTRSLGPGTHRGVYVFSQMAGAVRGSPILYRF